MTHVMVAAAAIALQLKLKMATRTRTGTMPCPHHGTKTLTGIDQAEVNAASMVIVRAEQLLRPSAATTMPTAAQHVQNVPATATATATAPVTVTAPATVTATEKGKTGSV